MKELYDSQGKEGESLTDFTTRIDDMMEHDIHLESVPVYAVPTGCEAET